MNIKKWQIFASIFCLILGTILHFTYEWFNYNVMVGLFSAVNESVWEHLKLLFYPMFFISIIGYFKIGRKLCNYWYTQMIGVVFTLIFVVVIYRNYRKKFPFIRCCFIYNRNFGWWIYSIQNVKTKRNV